MAVFLFFVALLSLSALQQGLYVLKQKGRKESLFTFRTMGLPILVLVAAIAIGVTGVVYRRALFVVFGFIAARTACKQLHYWSIVPGRQGWFFYHIENMFACCIGTVTAFAVTAVPRIFPQFDSLAIWIGPTVVMIPWMIWFIKAYEQKFGLVPAKK